MKISTTPEQIKDGLFGAIFVQMLEVLPVLDEKKLWPNWAIRSVLYGAPPDSIIVPGLLELNYRPGNGDGEETNLAAVREKYAVTLGNDWAYLSLIWHKYFRLPKRVLDRADQFTGLSQALGLHYRGTDKNKATGETNFVSQDNFLVLARDFVSSHPEIDTILIATDENAFVRRIEAEFKSLRVLHSGNVTHHKTLETGNNLAHGEHALLDCLLLSRCKYLLKCQSALSGFAKIFNPKVRAYRLSANMPWFWDIPNFPDAHLPKLTSQNPECQRILARLFAGDWTYDQLMRKKFGGTYQYKQRRRYMRKESSFSPWSVDGLAMRFDRLSDRLSRLALRARAAFPNNQSLKNNRTQPT